MCGRADRKMSFLEMKTGSLEQILMNMAAVRGP